MQISFVLLALAALAAWGPSIPVGGARRLPPWAVLLAAATASAVAEGFVRWPGVLALLLLAVLCWLSRVAEVVILRRSCAVGAVVLALALALHLVPGFANPVVAQGVRLSADATPYTLWLNFDKAAAGVLLLVTFTPRSSGGQDWLRTLQVVAVTAPVTAVVVIGFALVAGYVAWEPKLPPFTAVYLVANLLFTCVAEEAFFRGVAQRQLQAAFGRARFAQALAVACAALAFGAVHAGGGVMLIVIATLVGLGSGIAFARCDRIEAPIATHFLVNSLHFLLFTYPSIQGGSA